MDNKKIKGVLLDMDGTLFDTETASIFSWGVAAREFNLDIDKDFMLGCIGLPTQDIAKRFYDRFGEDLDYSAFREYKLKVMADIIEHYGPSFKKGAHELLDYIKSEGLKCALATSTTYRRAKYNLEAGGIFDAFDVVITSEMIKNGKPFPDPYVLAAGRLGLTPFDCAVVEDSENGILAAAASGAVSILVPDIILNDRMIKTADYQCESLLNVIDIIKEINS